MMCAYFFQGNYYFPLISLLFPLYYFPLIFLTNHQQEMFKNVIKDTALLARLSNGNVDWIRWGYPVQHYELSVFTT